LLQWVASFDGPSAFLATLLILHFCCVLVKCFCYMENKLSLSLLCVIKLMNQIQPIRPFPQIGKSRKHKTAGISSLRSPQFCKHYWMGNSNGIWPVQSQIHIINQRFSFGVILGKTNLARTVHPGHISSA